MKIIFFALLFYIVYKVIAALYRHRVLLRTVYGALRQAPTGAASKNPFTSRNQDLEYAAFYCKAHSFDFPDPEPLLQQAFQQKNPQEIRKALVETQKLFAAVLTNPFNQMAHLPSSTTLAHYVEEKVPGLSKKTYAAAVEKIIELQQQHERKYAA